MKQSEKKEILIKILESLFDDRTKEIDEYNCISFYHFLLNTLEDEIYEIPAEEDAEISLCFSIIELLCNFDLLAIECSHWNDTNTKNYIKGYGFLEEDEYQQSISKFRKVYTIAKGNYFLNLL
jgi:hypothetical protein